MTWAAISSWAAGVAAKIKPSRPGVETTRAPSTHYYTLRCWGHDYSFLPIDGGVRGSVIAWGRGIAAGDYLILQNGPDRTVRYRVTSICYMSDPADMWLAEVVFAPRKTIRGKS